MRGIQTIRAGAFTGVAVVMAAVGLIAKAPVTALSSCPTDPLSSLTPYNTDYSDSNAVNVGVLFKTNGSPFLHGVKFYKGVDNTGTHVAHLRVYGSNTDLASATFSGESSSGWQTVSFSSDVQVTGGTSNTYLVWVSMPNGHYAVDSGGTGGTNHFSNHGYGDQYHDVVYVPQGNSGIYSYSSSDATAPSTTTTANYWVSPIIGDTTAPSDVTSLSATDNQAGPQLSWSTASADSNTAGSANPNNLTVTRSDGVTTDTIGQIYSRNDAWTFWLRNQYNSIVQYDTSALPGKTYTYTVTSTDFCGNTSSGATASVSTASQSLSHIFSSNPSSLDSGQTSAVSVGMHWQSSVAGKVWGVRIYRDASAMPSLSDQNYIGGGAADIVGYLWDNDGTELAESWLPYGNDQSGWIDLRFSTPVDVSANHDYVVSYTSPTGKESYTTHVFNSAVTNGSLTARADSSGTPNGVYSTGALFPSTRAANSTWYGTDVDFYVP